MSIGLFALLDDVALIARGAAASLDDVAAQAIKAGGKTAGVVIDDAAVTPGYVVGFAPERELPMIRKIAVGSLRNKIVILTPIALALGQFAPWAITPLLVIGGLYLAYEGAEKIYAAVFPHAAHAHEVAVGETPLEKGPHALEATRVSGAIKTDFILSAEIMALTLSSVADAGLLTQAAVLVRVGLAVTVGVYGVVALIVKADDLGLRLARNGGAVLRPIGRGLVASMPGVLQTLTVVGTAAMLWVGGGILLHALSVWDLAGPERALDALAHAVAADGSALAWVVRTVGASLFGLVAGLAVIPLVGAAGRLRAAAFGA